MGVNNGSVRRSKHKGRRVKRKSQRAAPSPLWGEGWGEGA